MFCSQCGKQVSDTARFCSYCGKQLHSVLGNGNSIPAHNVINPVDGNPAPAGSVRNPVNVVNNNLPKDVFYDSEGRLCWYYRDYERNPQGNYLILHRFEGDRIAKYYGVDLDAKPQKGEKFYKGMNALAGVGMGLAILTGDSDLHETAAELYGRSEDKSDIGEIENYYYYKKVTLVERHSETGWVFFKHGFDRFFLRVNPEQFDFILHEFMQRCPKAAFGKVRK